MKQAGIAATGLIALWIACGAAHAAPAANPLCPSAPGNGQAQGVMAAIQTLQKTLTAEQRASLERPLDRESAIRWSNPPAGVVPRASLRLGDLDARQEYAARRVAAAALSPCGLKLLDEVRVADNFLKTADKRKIDLDGDNYFMSILGTPSATAPWMLQIGGHHIAYNITFNGDREGATPLFFGSEPAYFNMGDTDYEPLAAQSLAMSNLARALAKRPAAMLSGTFTDVVKGAVVVPVPGALHTGGTDSGFPMSFPTGSADRGVLYGALARKEQALVRAAIESYASLPGAAIGQPLVAAYLSPAALAQTYVGYAGTPDLSAAGSYVRIDGPRVWMELVVHAVADHTKSHFHGLWRDKHSDYGGQIAPK